MNHRRFRRLYREEKLQVRQRGARKRAFVNSGDKLVKSQRFENGHCVGWDGMVRPRGSSLPACSPP
jgi:hypothetical protein